MQGMYSQGVQGRGSRFLLQMAAFVAAVLGRAEQTPSIDVALSNMAVLDAAYRSAASGRAETVEMDGRG